MRILSGRCFTEFARLYLPSSDRAPQIFRLFNVFSRWYDSRRDLYIDGGNRRIITWNRWINYQFPFTRKLGVQIAAFRTVLLFLLLVLLRYLYRLFRTLNVT